MMQPILVLICLVIAGAILTAILCLIAYRNACRLDRIVCFSRGSIGGLAVTVLGAAPFAEKRYGSTDENYKAKVGRFF